MSADCKEQLEDDKTEGEKDNADPHAKLIKKEANEQQSEDIGQRVKRVKELKLSFGDLEMLVQGFLECLRVIESILVAEGHADYEHKEEKAYFPLFHGGGGVCVC